MRRQKKQPVWAGATADCTAPFHRDSKPKKPAKRRKNRLQLFCFLNSDNNPFVFIRIVRFERAIPLTTVQLSPEWGGGCPPFAMSSLKRVRSGDLPQIDATPRPPAGGAAFPTGPPQPSARGAALTLGK